MNSTYRKLSSDMLISRRIKTKLSLVALNAIEHRVAASNPSDLVNGKTRISDLVVSLTSYGNRLNTVATTIKTILNQTVLPSRIILYLDVDSEGRELPDELIKLTDYGLEVRSGYPNLGCHTKYYFAFKEFHNQRVLTIDDDVVYPPRAIETLIKYSQKYSAAVVALRVHKIMVRNGLVLPYHQWDQEWAGQNDGLGADLLATGVGGVLYPAREFNFTKDDEDAIRGIARYNDDLWLRVYETMHKIPVIYAHNHFRSPRTVRGTQDGALSSKNVGEGRNDIIFQSLLDEFDLKPTDFSASPDESTNSQISRDLKLSK